MERRELFATDLLSAFAMGNATDEMIPVQVATDNVGNRYVTGSFGGTVDFEPGPTRIDNSDVLTSNGHRVGFAAKYAPNDTLLWLKQFGAQADTAVSDDSGSGIALDADGSVIVSGRFGAGAADFAGATISSIGGVDGLLAQLNSSTGATQWVKTWGGANVDRGGYLAVDGTGNAFVTAETYNLGILYPAIGIALQKFSPSGSKVWQKDFATTPNSSIGQSIIRGIAADNSGSVVIVGTLTTATTDFDPSSKKSFVSSPGNSVAYAAKYDGNGTLKWVSPFYPSSNSTTARSNGASVAIDGSGNVFVGGSYQGPVDFNPGNGTTWLQDGGGFIVKLAASSGSMSWAKPLVQTLSQGVGYVTWVNSLATDALGNVYAAGIFQNSVDFDPGAGVVSKTSNGSWDFFLLNLTSSGQFGWADTIGGTGEDWVYDLAIDSVGNISIVGSFYGTVDFDPSTGTYERSATGSGRAGYLARYRRS